MGVDGALLRIAEMTADHYQSSSEFQREQVKALADVLEQIIDIVGFKAGPPYDEPLFESFVSVPRLLDHIRGLVPPPLLPKEVIEP